MSVAAEARIEVAFLEAWSRSGKKIELEKGDRFAHVAIRYQNKWFHASPANGAELVETFDLFGKTAKVTEILVNENAPDLTADEVRIFLGLPYDFKFVWNNSGGTYCSKLVAQLLAIAPVVMRFDGSYFAGIKNLPRGEPGISPDGVHSELLKRGYRVIQ